MAHRPELTALLQEHGMTREELDEIGNSECDERMTDPLTVTMLMWRAVELGMLNYLGDGYFELNEKYR